MKEDKRIGDNPVPGNLKELLNEAQLLTLRRMEEYGWELKFIRRPLFQDVIPVLLHPDNNNSGVLERDGTLNMQHDIVLRE